MKQRRKYVAYQAADGFGMARDDGPYLTPLNLPAMESLEAMRVEDRMNAEAGGGRPNKAYLISRGFQVPA